MQNLSQKIDQHLVDLAWSLWTELGVAGTKRQHQSCLIALEELILLTAVLAEVDPRLRDEALDWCSRYYHFVSISRLRTLLSSLGEFFLEPFSAFAATLNSVCRANWPVLTSITPLKFKPSGKSKSPRCELPALLCLRLRALFGVGARADLMTFFLTESRTALNASDTTEIGYSKRSLADLLDSFVESGLFNVIASRNQRHYSFLKRDEMSKILGLLPEVVPSWRHVLEMVLPLRRCIQQVENQSIGTKVTEIRNCLDQVEDKLQKLKLIPPPMQSDFLAYWDSFESWILKVVESYALGDFGKQQERGKISAWDEMRDAAKRIEIQFKGLFVNIESLNTHSNEQTAHFLFDNYKTAFQRHLNVYLPKLHTNDQKKIRDLATELLSKTRNAFIASLKEEVLLSVNEVLEKYF